MHKREIPHPYPHLVLRGWANHSQPSQCIMADRKFDKEFKEVCKDRLSIEQMCEKAGTRTINLVPANGEFASFFFRMGKISGPSLATPDDVKAGRAEFLLLDDGVRERAWILTPFKEGTVTIEL